MPLQRPDVSLADPYDLETGTILISGIQALVRLPLLQRQRDAAAGLDTAGFITGYRGSPLGGYDQQLWNAQHRLRSAGVIFSPAVNEELAATAVLGSQHAPTMPGARHQGVFALWYGKGPGVDRAGDAIKHGNRAGTSPHGGVLLVFGDDHAGKSSTVAHQSEQALAAHGVPVLYPSTVDEVIEFGLAGWHLSRYSGCWVGLKCVNETAESTRTVAIDPSRWRTVDPVASPAAAEVHLRAAYDPQADEVRLTRAKLPRALAFARANRLDRVMLKSSTQVLGLVAAGKSYLDVQRALQLLGLHDDARASSLGIGLYKPGLIWPLDEVSLREFAQGYKEILVIEEKAAFLEPQVARALFNVAAGARPALAGKRTPLDEPLLCEDLPLDAETIARSIAVRLRALGIADADVESRAAQLEAFASTEVGAAAALRRLPYFCAGCPHNTSTRIPEGSIALAGIGCHAMAMSMERDTLPPVQMGGEGLLWAGIAPFAGSGHVFQNLGDGTYFHSGLLAIRAAVHAELRITYKILLNDAVAMTGGQPVEGRLSAEEIAHQLRAERVQRIALVTDDEHGLDARRSFPAGTTVHLRNALDRVQRELREFDGVSALIYEQTCAAEKRRRRKRGQLTDPPVRVFINEQVCEGCGDCSVQSNCVAIEPVETPLGRKRRIDQSGCNKDLSCIQGFCPSFALLRLDNVAEPSTRPSASNVPDHDALPLPRELPDSASADIVIAGIGGSGIITVAALLAMAAHLEGRAANVFDMTGLAQKGGAVLSHLRIAPRSEALMTATIGARSASLVIGADIVVTASAEVLRAMDFGRTAVLLNDDFVPTAHLQLRPDVDFGVPDLRQRIAAAAGADRVQVVSAAIAAEHAFGDRMSANCVLLGYAFQRALLPVGLEALEQAIRLNGVAVDRNLSALSLGRFAAHDPAAFESWLRPCAPTATTDSVPANLESVLSIRAAHLRAYQDSAYAQRLLTLVEKVRVVERERVPGSREELATAVARTHSQLLAYKDEYEVARLHTDSHLLLAIRAQAGPRGRLSLLLSPPLLARKDPETGRPRKREFGPWIFPALRLLAKLRFLRGRWCDPFGHSADRKLERRLIKDYEVLVGELLAGLGPERHAQAVQLAELHGNVRGFGPVKHAAHAAMQRQLDTLRAQWRAAAAQLR